VIFLALPAMLLLHNLAQAVAKAYYFTKINAFTCVHLDIWQIQQILIASNVRLVVLFVQMDLVSSV
jgi:hypothetical protein